MNKRKTNPLLLVVGALVFLMLVGALASYFGKKVSPAAPTDTRPAAPR